MDKTTIVVKQINPDWQPNRMGELKICGVGINDADYRVTKFASTGGLLAVGTTTLMVVFNTDKLDKALDIIRTYTPPADPTISTDARVTIYVLPVKDFQRV